MDSQINELLDVQKAALFLGVSVSTIRRWAQQDKINAIKVGSRGDWRFTKEDLLQLTKKVTERRTHEKIP